MTATIIVDTNRAVAALVMDDPFFALGPAVAADEPDEAQELLQTFVDNLDGDPSQMPTIELMNQWQSFLMAFHGVIQVPAEVAAERSQQPAGEPETPSPGPEAGEPPMDPQNGADASGQASPVSAPDSEAGASPASEPTTPTPDNLPAPAAGEVECFVCRGAGFLEIEGQEYECKTCNGSGSVPAPAV